MKNEFEEGGYKVPNMGEFTKLKQIWQQKKGKSYQETEEDEILPGFQGQYYQ